MCAAYLQTCHFLVKIAVLNEKNVIHVNRVDPESFYKCVTFFSPS